MQHFTLTHWGRMTHICVDNLTIIGTYNGLSPYRRQPIIWTNDGILLIGPLGTNFSEISIAIVTFSFKKMHLKMLSAKWRPFCLSLNVLIHKARRHLWIRVLLVQVAFHYYIMSQPKIILAYYHFDTLNTFPLTHWGLVTQFGDIDLGQHWLR